MSNDQSRDELWSKHPLNLDAKIKSRGVLYSKSIEELEDVTSIQGDYVADVFSNEEMSAEETEELEVLMASLKNSDDVALPESGVYFDALEARIMGALDSAIEHGEVENRSSREPATVQEINPAVAKQAMKRAMSKRALAIRAGQMVMFVGVALVMTGKLLMASSPGRPTASSTSDTTHAPQARNEIASEPVTASSELRATHAAAPKVLTRTVMSFESENDLALEIAARRMVAYHKGE